MSFTVGDTVVPRGYTPGGSGYKERTTKVVEIGDLFSEYDDIPAYIITDNDLDDFFKGPLTEKVKQNVINYVNKHFFLGKNLHTGHETLLNMSYFRKLPGGGSRKRTRKSKQRKLTRKNK